MRHHVESTPSCNGEGGTRGGDPYSANAARRGMARPPPAAAPVSSGFRANGPKQAVLGDPAGVALGSLPKIRGGDFPHSGGRGPVQMGKDSG